jgi:hypothetical protein
MNFSKLGLGRQLAENVDPLEVAQGTRDNALTGGERQHQGTANLKQKQRQQLSLNKKPMKSDVTYATEGILEQRDKVELSKKKDKESTNWRSELKKQKKQEDSGPSDGIKYGRVPTRYSRLQSADDRKSTHNDHRLAASRQMDEAIEDIDVMPPTVKREKLMLGQGAKAAKDKKKNLEPSAPQAEAISFEDALQDLMEVTGLVDKSKPVAGTRYNRPYRTPVGEVKAMKKAQVKGNATDT